MDLLGLTGSRCNYDDLGVIDQVSINGAICTLSPRAGDIPRLPLAPTALASAVAAETSRRGCVRKGVEETRISGQSRRLEKVIRGLLNPSNWKQYNLTKSFEKAYIIPLPCTQERNHQN